MTSAAQLQSYEADGYLRFGPALTSAEVEALREGLDRVAAAELAAPDGSSPEFAYGHARAGDDRPPGARAITQFVNMWKRDAAFERVVRKPLLVEAAKVLLRTPRVRLWHDQVISKPPGDNGHFRFHQDYYFWPLSHPALVSCWIALDDATAENGCMHVIPGSHRDERFLPAARALELAAVGAGATSARQAIEAQPATVGRPVELAAGECMFHHCLNFHATPQNSTERQRRAFVVIYMADDVAYNPEQSPNHVLIPTIEVAPGERLVGAGFPELG